MENSRKKSVVQKSVFVVQNLSASKFRTCARMPANLFCEKTSASELREEKKYYDFCNIVKISFPKVISVVCQFVFFFYFLFNNKH